MKLLSHRMLIAGVLTLAVIAVPCTAWYVAGSKATSQEAERVERQMLFGAFKAAHGLAQRLGGHLEALRDAESRRPFYHYAPAYHDPTSDCACASVTPSPLARGPSDPLILAHFQLELSGRLIVPTLTYGARVSRDAGWVRQQRDVYRRLQTLKPLLTGMVCVDPSHGSVYSIPGTNVTLRDETKGASAEEKRSRRALWQEAAEYGATFNIGAPSRLFSKPDRPDYANVDSPDFANVKVGFFQWHTIELDGEPTLMAVRRVVAPIGPLLQCFVISSEFVNQSMRGVSYYPGEFVPGEDQAIDEDDDQSGMVTASVALPGVDWRVRIDTGEATSEAFARAGEIRSGFRSTFLWVTSASVLAGACIVGLLWQTDRLARQRQRFAASAAHELRTPLAGLRVYGDMLAEGLGDPTKTREYARQVSAEAERLGRVVSNVLGYSRLERGALSIRPQSGDLADAVRDCVGRFEAGLEAAGARVEVQIADNLPGVIFDRDAIFHILQNLLDNAEKYTRAAVDRTIRVALVPVSGAVELSVADHGPGISLGLRRHLFEPFARNEDKDLPAGLGLGLTLVQGLAEAHEGSVRYQDADGGGAVFTVRFPADEDGG